jgi:amino acid transporter
MHATENSTNGFSAINLLRSFPLMLGVRRQSKDKEMETYARYVRAFITGIVGAFICYLALVAYAMATYDPTYTGFPRSAAWMFAAISPVGLTIYSVVFLVLFILNLKASARKSQQ